MFQDVRRCWDIGFRHTFLSKEMEEASNLLGKIDYNDLGGEADIRTS